jgi:hypothetical protein
MPHLEIPQETPSANPKEQDELLDRVLDQRNKEREPFEETITLIGLDENLEPCSAPFDVVGRNISTEGVSILHEIPLMFRYVALEFAEEQIQGMSEIPTQLLAGVQRLVAKFAWCRYVGEGQYVSGGRFLKVSQTASD